MYFLGTQPEQLLAVESLRLSTQVNTMDLTAITFLCIKWKFWRVVLNQASRLPFRADDISLVFRWDNQVAHLHCFINLRGQSLDIAGKSWIDNVTLGIFTMSLWASRADFFVQGWLSIWYLWLTWQRLVYNACRRSFKATSKDTCQVCVSSA